MFCFANIHDIVRTCSVSHLQWMSHPFPKVHNFNWFNITRTFGGVQHLEKPDLGRGNLFLIPWVNEWQSDEGAYKQ